MDETQLFVESFCVSLSFDTNSIRLKRIFGDPDALFDDFCAETTASLYGDDSPQRGLRKTDTLIENTKVSLNTILILKPNVDSAQIGVIYILIGTVLLCNEHAGT